MKGKEDMTLFKQYLKSKRRMLAIMVIFWLVFAISFILYHLPLGAVAYPAMVCLVIGAVALGVDFARVKRSHDALQKIRSMTDVLSGSLTGLEGAAELDSITDRDYQEIIRLLRAEHVNFANETNAKYEDMIAYYTVWAHQIKTPIAAMRLNLQNEDSPLARKLSLDLRRIEQYVEMVLTYLRLDSESTDYVIKEYDLDTIVRRSVKKFSSEFIERRIALKYEPLRVTVVTDEKWLSFVIEQVISNALKYTPSDKTKQGIISISITEDKTLRIADTGIGIAAEDLPRIFENGYTGYNGRVDQRASGIGLYLCKRICSNLGHAITASSDVGVGTTIEISLAQPDFLQNC